MKYTNSGFLGYADAILLCRPWWVITNAVRLCTCFSIIGNGARNSATFALVCPDGVTVKGWFFQILMTRALHLQRLVIGLQQATTGSRPLQNIATGKCPVLFKTVLFEPEAYHTSATWRVQ